MVVLYFEEFYCYGNLDVVNYFGFFYLYGYYLNKFVDLVRVKIFLICLFYFKLIFLQIINIVFCFDVLGFSVVIFQLCCCL